MPHTVRIWDLPTRLFHWSLAVTTVALVVTAKLGGNAMQWHLRLGYVMLALLAFRLAWGLVGGRWSRFASFLPTPARLRSHFAHQEGKVTSPGHSPLGALSVFALLAVLLAQVGTGLLSDDEIAFAGPLTQYVSNAVVGLATTYHKDIGQFLVLSLVGLHVLAIIFYVRVRKQQLIRPMLDGDKTLPEAAAPSRDDALSRIAALVVLALSAGVAWWVSSLAAPAF